MQTTVCPTFIHGTYRVLENVPLAERTCRIRIECPEIAARIRPGQFVMLRLPNSSDPLLGRPFALYDVALDELDRPVGIDVVYLVVGKLTRLLTALATGDSLEVWGPLGNGFPRDLELETIGLVAGGIGQTPFLAYVRELLGKRGYGGVAAQRGVQHVRMYYGVRSASFAAGIEDFQRAGAEVHLATDDGSAGFRGFVTDLLLAQPRPQHLIGCGPEPMMLRLAAIARQWNVPCHLSLETPMACGIGICFSCVTQVRDGDGWDYRRVCIEGPVFDARMLWHADAAPGRHRQPPSPTTPAARSTCSTSGDAWRS